MAILAVDFDDTIVDNAATHTGYRMGPPAHGAVATLNKLAQEGHQIIIFTARNVQDERVKKAVSDWLDYFKIPYHGITNVKRSEFDIYIDNRALHYQSWMQVDSDLQKAISNWGMWSNHGNQPQHLIDDITKPLPWHFIYHRFLFAYKGKNKNPRDKIEE